MKKIFAFLLCALLVCSVADAQNLLKKLGKAVQKEVTGKVKEKVTDEVKKAVSGQGKKGNQTNKADQANQQQQHTAYDEYTSKAKELELKKEMAKMDRGENVVRQEGLDYIDEYGVNHGGGILIDSVLWAPVNCGYHPTDYPYGKIFQWGRKHGQGYGIPFDDEKNNVKPDKTTAELLPAPVTPAEALKHPDTFYTSSDRASFNWTTNDMSLWNSFTDDGYIFKNVKYDPCPQGWRLPDLHDFYCLSQNYSEMVDHPVTGQKGRWFTGSQPYDDQVQRIFLPAAGYRQPNGSSFSRDREGCYWSNRHGGGEGLVWHLVVLSDRVMVYPSAYPHEGYSVRCVKDREGQRMR